MPKRVHLPDGRIVNFPDSMTPDQIQAAMVKLAPQQANAAAGEPAPQPTMFGRPINPELTKALEGVEVMGQPLMPSGQAVMGAARAVAGLIPSAARAGAKFQHVMGAAKDAPVDVSGPGNAALRIMQMAERGGTMPKAVRDFLKRVTDPEKGPLTYGEARDFASNVSRLSADEFNRLTPALKREMGNLRVTLNAAVEKAAASAGQGQNYRSAMKEYARAARGREFAEGVRDVAASTAKQTLPLGAAGYAGWKLYDLLR